MTFFRSLVYQVFLILSVLVVGSVIVLTRHFISGRKASVLARRWAQWNLAALRHFCGLDLRVSGAQYLTGTTSIVLCNHQSSWETIALRSMLPLEHIWVVKAELIRVPVLGGVLRRFGAIAIDRSAGRRAIRQLLTEGSRWLGSGNWVVIFPEGTRVAHGDNKPYSIGGALLAERTGFPVVPVAHNSGLFWGRRRLIKHPGTVDLVIGQPIVSEGKNALEINREVEEWIKETVSRLPQDRRAGTGAVTT